ncbi:MAG: uncharacterized protein PWR24_201 [Desulfonauticus sp.]|jgi:hypothetical protein|nr:MAG: Putative DNA-binding protein with PD1-like DNA-binding motif [Desulfonauticus sp. 38_4375]MDK2920644.1 uncharacterized protein [Desulfonauticus sp.]
MYKKTKEGVIIGRIGYGKDLLSELNEIVKQEKINLGKVEAIGALQKATIAYYHQDSQNYELITFNQHLEIVSLIGNVSLKDNTPFVHAHITLGDNKGNLLGGHLSSESIVFACEFLIIPFTGPSLERKLDQQTGLPLWDI